MISIGKIKNRYFNNNDKEFPIKEIKSNDVVCNKSNVSA